MTTTETYIWMITAMFAYLFLYILAIDLIQSYKHILINKSDRPQQPRLFRQYSTAILTVLMIAAVATPYMGSSQTYDVEIVARCVVACSQTSLNLLFAMAAGMIILHKATSSVAAKGNLIQKIMTAPQWKILSRLSMCIMVLNVEIITYFADGREYLHPITPGYTWAAYILSIVLIHIVCAFVYVLVESPLQALIGDKLLRLLVNKGHSNRSRRNTAGETVAETQNRIKAGSD